MGNRAGRRSVLKLTEDSQQRRYRSREAAESVARARDYVADVIIHKFSLDYKLGKNDCPRGRLADYTIEGVLNSGHYGTVLQVAYTEIPGYTYALKVQEKDRITGEQDPERRGINQVAIERAILEKKLLWVLDSPFVLKAVSAFQDIDHLYLVTLKAIYGDLTALTTEARMDEQTEKYIIAQLVFGIEYLHAMGIAHRDIRPENVLIFERFYIKIAGLGLAKRLNGPTFTFVGRLEYLAPEVGRTAGYGRPVDWFALGCVSFELVYKIHPFRRPKKEMDELILWVLSNGYPVVPGDINFGSRRNRFISSLLQRDPNVRLGSQGANAVKNHVWFSDINFLDVLDRLVTFEGTLQPIEPKPGSAKDFEYLYETERAPDDDNNPFAGF